jgi:hypothetical protein
MVPVVLLVVAHPLSADDHSMVEHSTLTSERLNVSIILFRNIAVKINITKNKTKRKKICIKGVAGVQPATSRSAVE